MNRRLIGLTIVTASLLVYASAGSSGAAPAAQHSPLPPTPLIGSCHTEISRECSVTLVTQLQSVLKSYGYTIAVDGIYGPQTTGVVKSWQRSNGLYVDGIAGPVTLRSLGLDGVPVDPDTPKIATEPQSAQVSPPVPAPRSVEQIIRDVWPDDQEEMALKVAWRESRYVATAHNYCCHGIFAIYWSIHRSWLDDLGITSLDQLYDPETNIRAAYVLWQRSGSWSPWSQTAY